MTDYEIGVKISTTSDDAALKATEDKVEKLQKTTKETSDAQNKAAESTNNFTGALKRLVDAAIAFVAFDKVVGLLKESFQASIDAERAFRQLGAAVEAMGGSADQAAAVKDWADQLERISGVAETDIVPAFLKFQTVTEDTVASQRLVQTAIGLSKAGLGEYSEVVSTLGAVMAGLPPRGRGTLDLMLKQAVESGNLDQVLKDLISTYGDAGRALQDNATEVDRNRAAWGNTKEAIGGALTGMAAAARPVLQGLSLFLGMVEGGLFKLAGAAVFSFTAVKANVEAMGKALKGDFAGADKAFRDAMDRAKGEWDAYSEKATNVLDGIAQAWDTQTQAGNEGAKVREREVEAALAAAKARREKEAREAAAKAAKEKAEAELHAEIVALERAAQAAEAAERKKTESRKLWLQIRNNLTKEETDAEKKAAEERVRAYQAAAQREQRLKNLEAQTQKRTRRDDLLDLRRTLALELMAEGRTAEEIKRIKKAIASVDKEVRRDQAQAAAQAAGDMIYAAEAVFGQSKATGYAMAIVNAFMAYNNQLAQGDPWTAWVRAAAALAAGIAQASKIKSTEVSADGKGFDDPTNDAMARVGGRRWADDMVREFTAGVSRGWADAMRTSKVDRRVIGDTITDNRRSEVNLSVRQQILTRAQGDKAHRELEWNLRRARRANDRQVAGSGAVRVGKRG